MRGHLPTAHALGPKGSRAPSRRLAAGIPSVLTAREIHRGINFRETSLALGPSLQTQCPHITGPSESRVTAPEQMWPGQLPANSQASHRNLQGTHTTGFKNWGQPRLKTREGLWSCSGKEVGQAWAVGQMETPIPVPITTLTCLILSDLDLGCPKWEPAAPWVYRALEMWLVQAEMYCSVKYSQISKTWYGKKNAKYLNNFLY